MNKENLEAIVACFVSDSDARKSAVNRMTSALEKKGSTNYKLSALAGSLAKWQETTEFADDDNAELLVQIAQFFAEVSKENKPETTAKITAKVEAPKPARTAKKSKLSKSDAELMETAIAELLAKYAGR